LFIKNNIWDEARVFSSNKKLVKGLKAPKINGNIIVKKKVGNDELEIIKPF
jgi:diaminohydroxyphosphoribosylaminopyrimidine deaminase/5-amino-6-(5-phosphoribosylamino)uracil reductase